MDTANAKKEHILLYDGICNLCSGLVHFVKKRENIAQLIFLTLQSPKGQSLLKEFMLPADDLDSVVYIRDCRYYLKSSAILHILKDLGGFWKLFYILIIIPRFIRDFVYNIVAKTRYRIFGSKDSCIV